MNPVVLDDDQLTPSAFQPWITSSMRRIIVD